MQEDNEKGLSESKQNYMTGEESRAEMQQHHREKLLDCSFRLIYVTPNVSQTLPVTALEQLQKLKSRILSPYVCAEMTS